MWHIACVGKVPECAERRTLLRDRRAVGEHAGISDAPRIIGWIRNPMEEVLQ
jgi:hypothetical protein